MQIDVAFRVFLWNGLADWKDDSSGPKEEIRLPIKFGSFFIADGGCMIRTAIDINGIIIWFSVKCKLSLL